MAQTVAIIAPGSMGSAVGRRLVEGGLRVVTALDGRSQASAGRAAAAGMEPVADAALAEADIILSIVPPGDALVLAERLAPVLSAAARKPLYADCNAVNPATVARIAAVIAATGCDFVDGGIIGGPPRPGTKGPVFYASGEAAPDLAVLKRHGLDVQVLDGPVGAASALKMSYAGITKGLTALASAMLLAASRAGAAEALAHELATSQPVLLDIFRRSIPGMYPKAYRWVAEMEEISAFVAEDPGAAQIFAGAAQLYERLAQDVAGEGRETAALSDFLTRGEAERQAG
jgi:L-threonate 2-dehydrogenase